MYNNSIFLSSKLFFVFVYYSIQNAFSKGDSVVITPHWLSPEQASFDGGRLFDPSTYTELLLGSRCLAEKTIDDEDDSFFSGKQRRFFHFFSILLNVLCALKFIKTLFYDRTKLLTFLAYGITYTNRRTAFLVIVSTANRLM